MEDSKTISGNSAGGSGKTRKRSLNYWGVDEDVEDAAKKMKESPSFTGDTTTIVDLKVGRTKDRIVVRCTKKGNYKEMKYGGLISFHAMDISGEIGVVAYGNNANTANELVQVNGVYKIEDFKVSVPRNTKFAIGNSGFEITLDNKSQISEDNSSDVPKMDFKFITLEIVDTMEEGADVDCMLVVTRIGELEDVNGGYKKIDFEVTDKTKICRDLIVWGEQADKVRPDIGSVIIVRRGRIKEFQAKKNINVGFNGLVWIDPDLEAAAELKTWFIEESKNRPASQ